MLLQYAWKGFWRRRTRSMLAVLGIALSIGLLVAVVTITGSVGQAVGAALDAAGADMVIQSHAEMCPFNIIKLPKNLVRIDESIVEKLRDHPGVAEATGVLELWAFHSEEGEGAVLNLPFPKSNKEAGEGQDALLATGQESPMLGGQSLEPTVVAGLDPSKKTIGPVRIKTREEVEGEDESCCAVTSGRYLVPDDDYHVMITEEYAEAKGLERDDMMPLGIEAEGIEHEFEIVALMDISGAARIAGAEAFIPLKTAQALLKHYSGASVPGDVVSTIFISLNHKRDITAVSEYAAELIGEGVSITTEANVDAGTAALASVTRRSLLAISGFVLCFALLLLIRNALDNVAQRVDEVGVMKAIGWRNADVARLFVVEAGYAGLFGGTLGSILGSAAGWMYGNMAKLQLPSSLAASPACRVTELPLALPLATNPSIAMFALGLALALAIGTIAGLVASRRAAQLDPVEALRRL